MIIKSRYKYCDANAIKMNQTFSSLLNNLFLTITINLVPTTNIPYINPQHDVQ